MILQYLRIILTLFLSLANLSELPVLFIEVLDFRGSIENLFGGLAGVLILGNIEDLRKVGEGPVIARLEDGLVYT
jgi:hypothetical protein